MGCRTEKFGAAALLFTFLIETTNGQILKNVPKTVFCVWVDVYKRQEEKDIQLLPTF